MKTGVLFHLHITLEDTKQKKILDEVQHKAHCNKQSVFYKILYRRT